MGSPQRFRPATVGVDEGANCVVRTLGGRERVVVFLWHPTGMTAPKDFPGSFPHLIGDLRAVAAGDLSVQKFAARLSDEPDFG